MPVDLSSVILYDTMQKMKKWFKKYFIPHEENDHKPHILRMEAVVVFLSFILFIEVLFLVQMLFVFPNTNFFASILPGVLVDITNQNRVVSEESPLKMNPVLDGAAQAKAEDMAKRGYFSHNDPDGREPWYWFEQAGYNFRYAGENLAINFSDSEDVVDAWMKSLAHRANILNGNFTEIGIGIAKGKYQGQDTLFVVQFFGEPVSIKSNMKNVVSSALGEKVNEKQIPVEVKEVNTEKNVFKTNDGAYVEVLDADSESFVSTGIVEGSATEKIESYASVLKHLIASPRAMSNYLYFVILTIVGLGLALTIFIKIKVQHPRLIINGAALLLVIGSLLVINQYISVSQVRIF